LPEKLDCQACCRLGELPRSVISALSDVIPVIDVLQRIALWLNEEAQCAEAHDMRFYADERSNESWQWVRMLFATRPV
jgi:hypothetical protein